MNTIPRSAGIGLLVYAVGTTVGFAGAGGPGGDYESAMVAGYVEPSHYATSIGFWYLGALAALGLLAFGHGLRRLGGAVGGGGGCGVMGGGGAGIGFRVSGIG